MLIADALITKQYWEPVFGQIQANFENGSYKKLSGIDVYKMAVKNSPLYVAAKHEEAEVEVYGWLLLEKPSSNWEAYEVAQSFVFTSVRGEGWGKLLYDTVISREGLILASGCQQSRSARRLWKTMIKNDQYHIWAHDFRNTKNYAPVIYDPETDEIWSSLRIYEKFDSAKPYYSLPLKQDIRLIAIKKV